MKYKNYIKGIFSASLLFLSLIVIFPAQAFAATPVKVVGRQLLVDFDGNGIYELYTIRGAAYNPYPVGVFPTEWGTCEYCVTAPGCYYPGGISDPSDHFSCSADPGGGPHHPWGGQACGGYLPFPNQCVNLFDRGDVDLDRDFQALVSMNVNTIRTWEKVTPTLLAKANQSGIKVIAGYWIGKVDFTVPGQVDALKNDFQIYIQHMVADPNFSAILFIAIGNENNYHYYTPGVPPPPPPYPPECYIPPSQGPIVADLRNWYDLVDQLALIAHQVTGMTRPVAVVNGEIAEIGNATYHADDAHQTHVDIWGANVYRGISFGSLFSDYASRSLKPLWLSECGADAVYTNNFYDQPPNTPPDGFYNPLSASQIPSTQALWNAKQWKEIVSHTDTAIGATFMEYSDEWWKGVVENPYHWDEYTRDHNYSGICYQYAPSQGSQPDNYFNEEWWGLMAVEVDNGPGIDQMTPRPAYNALRDSYACDTEPNIYYAGPYTQTSCDGTHTCCSDPNKKSKNGQCVTSCGGCFLAGTPISMADKSQKFIEQIKVGDMVLAYDEENKELKPDKVTKVFSHPKEDNYLIINGHLRVTPIHPVLSKGKWRQIGELKVGDTLTDVNGQDVPIKDIARIQEKIDVYNFETDPYHTYIAGGYIVHNRKLPYTIYDPGGGP